MKIIQEFREFAMKGSVMDLAVGVVIGGAFGKIVSSLVNDIIMPPIGLLMGGINFRYLRIVLSRGTNEIPATTWNYGNFLQNTLEFVIIAFAIFMMIKAINAMKRKSEAAAPPSAPPKTEVLLEEIRDLMKK